jgi:phosphate transport system substrate-binding protein
MTERVNPANATSQSFTLASFTLASFALATALAFALLALPAAHADEITLTETGSTLLYPLFNVWVSEYAKGHPGVHIATNGTGSAAGIEQAVAGTVQIGTSDAYMSDAQAKRDPEIINVPMAISAMTINFNLPGLNTTQLKLDGPVLAGIYAGRIRAWDDKSIAALNPDVKLPHHDIIPIPPRRRFRRHLRVHPISDVLHPVLGGQTRLWHLDCLA